MSVGKIAKREVSSVASVVTPEDDIETTTMTTLTTMKPVRKVKKKTKCFDEKHACYLNTYNTPLDKVKFYRPKLTKVFLYLTEMTLIHTCIQCLELGLGFRIRELKNAE